MLLISTQRATPDCLAALQVPKVYSDFPALRQTGLSKVFAG